MSLYSKQLSKIKRAIEKEVGFKIDVPSRKREITYARAIYYDVARRQFVADKQIPLAQIGAVVNRSHANILHSLNNVLGWVMEDTFYSDLHAKMMDLFPSGEELSDNKDSDKLRDIVSELKAKNEELKLALSSSKRFYDLIEGLYEDEVEQMFEKLEIMAKVMKKQKYA